MRIKKIELVGFKSFKDRTVIHFEGGITGIVGPNGCGKSNIVDALVWVMGEMSAKDLRGSSMSDVIFAGAEGYAPAGMAEVSLTLENDGGPFPAQYLKHSEIMVTRRLHRSGDSEYEINREPARLRDVQEIFMDTGAGAKGFSIIQQGMIGRIITAKAEDRRMLIEEAAGITKFKARKRESLRRMEQADQNLVRLHDIVGELKRQIDSLQRQAAKAERYRGLKQELEALDLCLAARQFVELKAAADSCQKIFQDSQALESSSEAALVEVRASLESLRLELLQTEKQLTSSQDLVFERQGEVQKIELEIQQLRFEMEQARRSEEMSGSLFLEQKARLELLERDQSLLQAQWTEAEQKCLDLETKLKEKSEVFAKTEAGLRECDDRLTENRREALALGQTEAELRVKSSACETQLEDLRQRELHQREVQAELAVQSQEFRRRKTRLTDSFNQERQMQLTLLSDVEAFEANRKALQQQILTKRGETDEFQARLNEVAGKLYGLESLQESFEGFADGVKSVLMWQKTRSAEISVDGSVSYRPVSEVVEVPAEYELAMEAALGDRLQMLVTRTADSSLQAVDYLKSVGKGRSSFWSQDASTSASLELTEGVSSGAGIVGSESLRQEGGVQQLLREVVQAPAEYQSSVSLLLDGVAVVDSLRTALRLRPSYPGWSFVTREGDVLSREGVLTGGAEDTLESGVLQRRREIKELRVSKEEWSGKLALAQAALKKLEQQLLTVTSDFEGAALRRQEQEVKVAEIRKDLERATQESENAEQASSRQERELLKLGEQIREVEERLEKLRTAFSDVQLRRAQSEGTVSHLDMELTQLRREFDLGSREMSDLQMRAQVGRQELQGLHRQREMVTLQVNDLSAQLSRIREESAKNNAVLSDSQVRLETRKFEFEKLSREVEVARQSVSELHSLFDTCQHKVRTLEEQESTLQRQSNERLHAMNEAQLRFEQAKMKEQYLTEQMRDRYQVHLAQSFSDYLQRTETTPEAEEKLKELREKVAKVGEVNLSAISEYQETAQRYEFLSRQQADLLEAKDQLRKVIDKINRICSRRFKETFELVNERFSKVFPVLFGGGEARLELVEDLEKSEMGIEIVAKPPGKKMQSISLLSGGEKALTAVALVFSIFLVRPSPYCLLDEVDAPLDDANVFRFNDLVREMAKRSQIIVVTHNKHTMEVAEKLFGVTMQERGVSKLVSVNLKEAAVAISTSASGT